MLILTRKTGEEITIGENVTVRVIAVQEGQVKLGIEAPKELKIYRGEIYELIQQQNMKATQISKSSVAKAAGLLSGSNLRSKKGGPGTG
ncbi:MAG: carbon storage regulator CsrA [Ignavibacteria bacterium]|nr:carbon storage regulator CsrA [Ignavibacteria bacterium]